jgi:hypothetical protein
MKQNVTAQVGVRGDVSDHFVTMRVSDHLLRAGAPSAGGTDMVRLSMVRLSMVRSVLVPECGVRCKRPLRSASDERVREDETGRGGGVVFGSVGLPN